MATNSGEAIEINLPAAADLSALQYRFMLIDSSGNVNKGTGNSTIAIGVLQNKPSAAAQGARVRTNGKSKLDIGGTVACGDRLTSDSNGKGVVTTTATHLVGAIALTSGVSGDRIEALLIPASFGA